MLEETRCTSSPPPPQVPVVSQALRRDLTAKRTVWVGGSPGWHRRPRMSRETSCCPSDPHSRVCTRHSGLPWSPIHGASPSEWSGTREARRKASRRSGEHQSPARAALCAASRARDRAPHPTEQVGGDTRLPPPVSWEGGVGWVLGRECCMQGSLGIATRVQRGLERRWGGGMCVAGGRGWGCRGGGGGARMSPKGDVPTSAGGGRSARGSAGSGGPGGCTPILPPAPRGLQGRSRDVTAAGSARRWRGRGWPSRRLIKLSPRGAQSRSRASPVSPHPHPAGHRPLGPGHLATAALYPHPPWGG